MLKWGTILTKFKVIEGEVKMVYEVKTWMMDLRIGTI